MEGSKLDEFIAVTQRSVLDLELEGFRLRAQARGLEAQADETDVRLSAAKTSLNVLTILRKEISESLPEEGEKGTE